MRRQIRLPWTSRVTLISQALRHQSRPTHTLPVRRALHRFRPHLAPITIRVDRSDVFVTKINASGTALVYSSFLRRRPVAHDSSGNLYLPSDTAILERVNISTPLPPGPCCVTNAASFWGTAVSPGEIVSLFGPSIGPDTPATLELDDAGRVSSRLSEIRVLFNAMPAPLLYVSKNQINAVVPFGVAGLSQVNIQIEKN